LIHQSPDYTVTRESNYLQASPSKVGAYAYDTLVLEVVYNLFREAAVQFVKTNGSIGKNELKRSHSAMMFIAGTKLDMMLEVYHLDLDADALRRTFYRKFHIAT